jgi:hypothetical protein
MTGPEHYIEAEHLLAGLDDNTSDRQDADNTVALAQVHATLALAAATASGAWEAMDVGESRSWDRAIGGKR